MKTVKGHGKAISSVKRLAILMLVVFVSVEVLAANQAGDLNPLAPVSAVNDAVTSAHGWVACQLDKIHWAICSTLAQFESACMRGFV